MRAIGPGPGKGNGRRNGKQRGGWKGGVAETSRGNRNRLDRPFFGGTSVESRTEPCSSRLLAPSPAIGHRFKAYGAPWRGRFGQLYVATIPQSLHPSPNRTSLRFFPVSPPDFTGSIRDSRCVLVSFRGCSETAVQMARRSKRAVHTTR